MFNVDSLFGFRWSRIKPISDLFDMHSNVVIVSKHSIQVLLCKDEHVHMCDRAHGLFLGPGVD